VTPWPQEVTAQMVANFLASGAVVNAIAAQAGAEVCVVDVGVAADLPPAPGLLPRKVRPGTADMTAGPAMSVSEAQRAVEAGIETARDLVAAGNRCLVTGDMGIANTTASAALIAVFTGAEAQEVTGRGTGIDDQTWERKVGAVRRALARHRPDPAQPLAALAAVGGLEHAALAGFMLGGAALRVPVVLDGVIACAAALVARALAPDVVDCLIAGHVSTEPGARRALTALGLRPVLDLECCETSRRSTALACPAPRSRGQRWGSRRTRRHRTPGRTLMPRPEPRPLPSRRSTPSACGSPGAGPWSSAVAPSRCGGWLACARPVPTSCWSPLGSVPPWMTWPPGD
jgi:nicotinate-nucleotide--dimethylbenzimidazole phosphoribosyltransferase